MAIRMFKGEFDFLSNFYIEPDNTHVEGEYQAAKCLIPLDGFKFINLTPAKAKALGRKIPLRPDWEDVKLEVMYELCLAKFTDHRDLATKLDATGNEELIEGNYWCDWFWGVTQNGYGVGQNHLGKILMRLRSELR